MRFTDRIQRTAAYGEKSGKVLDCDCRPSNSRSMQAMCESSHQTPALQADALKHHR